MHTKTKLALAMVIAGVLAAAPTSARPLPAPGVIAFEHELTLGEPGSSYGAQSAVAADFDGDGLPDIASIGTLRSGALSVHLNDPLHQFSRVLSSPEGDVSAPLVAGDFDEDGHMDVVNGTWLFRCNGDGTFATHEALITESLQWRSMPLAADLDGDGHLDLALSYVPDTGSVSVLGVLWGRGDGTFGPRQDVATLGAGFGIHLAADLTGDGRADLVGGVWIWSEASEHRDTLVVFPNRGMRAFGPPVRTPTAGQVRAIAVADLDHDGRSDLVMPDRVHRGDGTGAFDPAPQMLPGGGGEAVVTPDLDHDGWNDIVVRGSDAIVVLRNLQGEGFGFEHRAEYLSRYSSYYGIGLVVADLDLDGTSDVITYPHRFVSGEYPGEHRGLGVFFGRPYGGLEGTLTRALATAADLHSVGALTAIHLRTDGIEDLVQARADSLHLMRNLGLFGFGSSTNLGPGWPVEVVDLDHDGIDDLVSRSDSSIEVRLGDPVSGLGPPAVVGTGQVLAVGEVDGGPGVDLVVREASGEISLLSGDGAGRFAPALPLGLPTRFVNGYGCQVAAADLDGDGLDDLVLASGFGRPFGDSILVFHSNGQQPMLAGQVIQHYSEELRFASLILQLELVDLDLDGDRDLLVVQGGNYSSSYMLSFMNDGAGNFTFRDLTFIGPEVINIVAGDLDGDGAVDVASSSLWDGALGVIFLMRGNGDGTFERAYIAPDPQAHSRKIAMGHFDADHRLDLACCSSYGILVLRNISTPGEVTPVAASLVSASIEDGLARVTWSTDAAPGIEALVFRSVDGAAFAEVARLHPDGDGRVRHEDASIAPGHRYGYRLAFAEGGQFVTVNETWLEAPLAATLALAGATPNPVAGDLMVAFSLARRGPGTLALFDLAGRRIAEHDLAQFAPGAHRVRLSSGDAVAPGLYFIRLVTTERTLGARAIVVR